MSDGAAVGHSLTDQWQQITQRMDKMNTRDANVPNADELAIEKQLVEKGLNAPRLTPEFIDAQIVSEAYYVFPGTALTVCALTLQNGFQVTGESAAVSLENFDQEIGRTIARRNARDKIWSLEGYLLKHLLYKDKYLTTLQAETRKLIQGADK